MLKTIGNRKADCAWSCSRWQTQPEKICKSQCTNQCHSLRTLYWFVLCNLQIFSGCVCHLEQLHAQSAFLFPIVFSINLILFFDICSVLAVLSPGLFGYQYVLPGFTCCFTWATARSQQLLFVVLAAGLWCFTAGWHVKCPLSPTSSQTEVCSTMGETRQSHAGRLGRLEPPHFFSFSFFFFGRFSQTKKKRHYQWLIMIHSLYSVFLWIRDLWLPLSFFVDRRWRGRDRQDPHRN